MNTKALIAIALAALLVFAGGAAAMPGNAPDGSGADAANDHAPDEPDAAATNATDDEMNETDERDENAPEGPPVDMPEPVPDHVSEIHQLIRDKLNGDLGNTTLGEAISGVVDGNGADEAADSDLDDESTANETRTSDETDASEDTETTTTNASLVGDLPEQAADHVSAIHDAITSFLNGDGDGNPGDAVSGAAQG